MPTVNITNTESNPTHIAGYGGGLRDLSATETSPTFYGGAGGGWRSFTETERNPEHKIPTGTDTLGKTKGLDFRGTGFRGKGVIL
ncbi:hypothetical protein ES703_18964 [subsurface metagenome]